MGTLYTLAFSVSIFFIVDQSKSLKKYDCVFFGGLVEKKQHKDYMYTTIPPYQASPPIFLSVPTYQYVNALS